MRTAAALCCLFLICTPPALACTTFCLDTPDGPVYGANLDLITGDGYVFVNHRGLAKEGYGTSTTGEPAHWVSRYGSVTFNLAGRELPWSGMNEAGLVMTSLQLLASRCPAPDERPPLSEGYLVQYVLDTAATVEEAIAAVERVRPAQHECGSHYMLTDATGAGATVEFLDGQYVFHVGETLPVKALANAPYAAGVDFMERGVVPADNPGASVQRVADAAGMAAAYDPAGGVAAVDYVFDVLTETVVAPKKWWSNLFHEPYTRWNVVFDVANRTAHFRTVEHHAVRTVTLDSFDLACDAPILMLDVNAKLAGNIDRSFGPYDHDANLEVFREFCDKWGIEVTREGSAELIAMFESFACAEATP